MTLLSFEDFLKVDMRVGRIIEAEDFPEAKKPAYKLKVDFGPSMGIKQSSAQITTTYSKEELPGRLVVAVTNFPPKQIGPFISEVLVLGIVLDDGRVPLLTVDEDVPLGLRIS